MYAIGDLIVYGAEGVYRVEDIGCPGIMPGDQSRTYYTLTPLFSAGKTYAPVDSSVKMRPIMTGESARQLVHKMPSIQADVYEEDNLHKLTDHYKSVIRTYDCEKLVRLIKAIYVKGKVLSEGGKKLGQVDQRFMKRAEDMLHEELSAALEIPKDDVRDYIEERVDPYDTVQLASC